MDIIAVCKTLANFKVLVPKVELSQLDWPLAGCPCLS
jgi:hypothetical protein